MRNRSKYFYYFCLQQILLSKAGFTDVPDVLTKNQRSYNMSRIRNKNTTPELLLRKRAWHYGLRNYRIHGRLPGKPDMVFIREHIAVFVDGCFWHKCPICFVEPETRRDFWIKKIERNVQRDGEVNKVLARMGWKVLRFWEHEVRSSPDRCVATLAEELLIHRGLHKRQLHNL